MKKFISLTLVLMLALSITGVTAYAGNEDVHVDGYIGLDDTTNPEELIDLKFSAGPVYWSVTDLTAPAVVAADYTIENLSKLVDLEVTLKSFTKTNATVIPGTLVLNLTDDLAKANVVGITGGTTPYAAKLLTQSTWTYSFDGTYTGSIPATPLQPEYNMVLNFAIAD